MTRKKTKTKINLYTDKNFIIHKKILKNMINQMIKKTDRQFENIELSFLTDKQLLEINQKFLKHNTYTDIITFVYDSDHYISTEILISYERAYENSKKFQCSFEDEILRLIAHGILHSVGLKDKTELQKLKMRQAENDLLTLNKRSNFIKKFETEKIY